MYSERHLPDLKGEAHQMSKRVIKMGNVPKIRRIVFISHNLDDETIARPRNREYRSYAVVIVGG